MFQRVQSIYIIISIALLSVMYFIPLGELILESSEIYNFSLFNISVVTSGEVIVSSIALAILIAIIQLLMLVSLFLYKKRSLQIRLCVYSIITSIGFYGIVGYYFMKLMNNYEMNVQLSYSLIFPIIAIVFMYLAMRAIRKDENLVRSVDRLR